jgi:glycosyltransferase involved in cell wall biosynthesis
MRLAFVLGTTAGGTGPHVAMLARECAARGMAVRVFGPGQAGQRFFAASAVPGGPPAFVEVDIADRPRPGHDLAAVLRLRRLLRAWAPDIVHAHGLRAGGLAALALSGGRATRRRPPVPDRNGPEKTGQGPGPRRGPALVITVHSAPLTGGMSGLAYAALERIAARRADAVTWVSSDLAGRMRRAGARDAGRALVPAPEFAPPSAGQIAAVRTSLGGEHRPVVFAAGRLVPQKGYPVLLAAASSWQHRDPVPLLVIAGEGPLAGPLASEARSSGITVRFLGQRADIPALLGAADVVVVPSLWEGQPLIVQETLRMGRPLVASRTGGIPDVTGDDAAMLIPHGDPVALGAAVESVLGDPGLAGKLAAAAAQRAAELPDTSDAVDSVTRLYARLLRAAGRRCPAADDLRTCYSQ